MKYCANLAAILIVSVLAGCATAYQAQNFSGGFTETQLDTNIFKVSFEGNGYTSPERAEEMALLRSADIALKNGFTHFAVIDGRSRADYATFTTPTQSNTNANVTLAGNTAYGRATTTTFGGQSFLITRSSATNTIMCFNGKPDVQGLVYDAKFVFNSLAQKYGVNNGAK